MINNEPYLCYTILATTTHYLHELKIKDIYDSAIVHYIIIYTNIQNKYDKILRCNY